LYFLCNDKQCVGWNPLDWTEDLPKVWGNVINGGYYSHEVKKHVSLPYALSHYLVQALIYYLGWMAFHVFLERVLPGETAEGVPLDDGKRLKYTLSGHLQFWLTFGVIFIALPTISPYSGIADVYR